ncbi:MAG: hypothetical protein U5M51_12715 [Emticicia sp.]|nr:hypothetical protein [Emticicia sp.]
MINQVILQELLNNNQQAYEGYSKVSGELQKELFKNFLMSCNK